MIFETKKGHKIEYKTAQELTAKEWREMKGVLAAKSKVSVSGSGIDPVASLDMEDEVMRHLVVSVNGIFEKPFDALMNTLSAMEYEELKNVVADIFDDLTKKLQT